MGQFKVGDRIKLSRVDGGYGGTVMTDLYHMKRGPKVRKAFQVPVERAEAGTMLTSTPDFPHLTVGTPVMVHVDKKGPFVYCNAGVVYLDDYHNPDGTYRGFIPFEPLWDDNDLNWWKHGQCKV